MDAATERPVLRNSVLIVLYSIFCTTFLLVTGVGSLAGVYLSLYVRNLGASNLTMGLVPLLWCASTISCLPGGYLSERLRDNKWLTIAGLLTITVIIGVVTSLPLSGAFRGSAGLTILMIGFFVSNLLLNVYQCAFYAWLPDLVGLRDMGKLQSFISFGAQAATVAMMPLAGAWLNAHSGGVELNKAFAWLFLAASLCGALSVVPLLLARGISTPHPVSAEPFLSGLRQLLADANFRRFLYVIAAANMAPVFAGAYGSIFLRETIELDYKSIGIVVMLAPLASLLTTLAWGRAADRIGGRLTLLIGIIGMALQPGLTALATVGHVLPAYIGQIIGGALGVSYNVGWALLMYKLTPEHKRATALGLVWIACGIGGVFMPFLGAGLVEWMGPLAIHVGSRTYHALHVLLLLQALLAVATLPFCFSLRVPGETASASEVIGKSLRNPVRTVWLAMYGDQLVEWIRKRV